MSVYVYHKLVKFEQNQIIRTTQNLAVSRVNQFEISLASFWKEVSVSEKINSY